MGKQNLGKIKIKIDNIKKLSNYLVRLAYGLLNAYRKFILIILIKYSYIKYSWVISMEIVVLTTVKMMYSNCFIHLPEFFLEKVSF